VTWQIRSPKILIAGGLALAVLVGWATWPTAGQLSTTDCSPDGILAKLSSAIHGERFWRVQLADITRQRQVAANWDEERANMLRAMTDDALRKAKEMLKAAYEKHPSLAPTPTLKRCEKFIPAQLQ
jgi:hypothetical protein